MSTGSLNELFLYNNELSGPIPSYLGNSTGLTSLQLGSNKLTGSVPPSLGNLVNLTTLNLGNNSLTGSIPSSLGNLVRLTTLNPRCVTKQFMVDIVLEYQKNLVNWALYGQETNNSQRRKYEQDLSKLQYAINAKAQVTKRSWRSLKVDAAVKMEPGL